MGKVDELGAAGTQGRTDDSPDPGRIRTESSFKGLDDSTDDIEPGSPPAVVHGCDDLFVRDMEKNGLTIGLLDQKPGSRHVGDQGVAPVNLPVIGARTDDPDPVAVHLPG